jgi:heptaprenyl diphosphate synthase
MKKSKKIAIMALMVTVALILGLVENALPIPMIAPGAKIGLANIVTMICIALLTPAETLAILIIRIVLGSLYSGGFSGFIYSFAGGMLSFAMMLLIVTFLRDKVSMIGISVTGAFFHSMGQVLAASVILQNVRIMSYLPLLLATSIFAGIFIGMASDGLVRMSAIKRQLG